MQESIDRLVKMTRLKIICLTLIIFCNIEEVFFDVFIEVTLTFCKVFEGFLLVTMPCLVRMIMIHGCMDSGLEVFFAYVCRL